MDTKLSNQSHDLELCRGAVPEVRVPTLPIVEHLDVIEQVPPGLRSCGVVPMMNPILFQRREETLRHRVVVTVPLAAHAADQPVFFQQGPVIPAGVLAPAVGVVEQPPGRTTARQGHPQRVQGQFPGDSRTHRPAHHRSGEKIEENGQIHPSLPRGNVRDVRHPHPVGSNRLKVAGQQIRRHRKGMGRVGRRRPELPTIPGLYPVDSHQTSHTMLPARNTLVTKLRMNPGAAIRLFADLVNRTDLRDQSQILTPATAHRPFPPNVISAPGHLKHPAHLLDAVNPRVVPQEPILHFGPLEKMANALFRIARSSFRSSFSRFSRRSSSSCGIRRPLPGNASVECSSNCRHHFPRTPTLTPRSLATCERVRPSSFTRRAASTLNSFVNFLRPSAMTHLPRYYPLAFRCVHKTGGTPIERFKTERKDGPTRAKKVRSGATVNREMTCLGAMLNKAVKWELIPK